MKQKFSLAGDSRSFLTVRRPATGTAIAKGEPVIQSQTLCFTFDDYEATEEQVLVYFAEKTRVTAQVANGQIASVNFAPLGFIFWDDTAKKITNVSEGNTWVGRNLEGKDYSGGVPEGAELIVHLMPSI